MDISLLYHPHHREEVSVTVDMVSHDDLTYSEWVELMEKVENGSVSYATWYQDEEETNDELMVLIHEYIIRDGEVVNYREELTD